MGFKKLALAAAVAAAPMSALALEPMQDEALSGVTGQDGISISLATDISASLIVHDADGLAAADGGTDNSGALVINGFAITRAATTDAITLDIDADAGTTGAFLNIGVSLPTGLQINLGTLDIADSNRTTASTINAGWGVAGGSTVASVVTLGTMTLGTTTLNIQLGNEPQGDMIALNTSITGGISLAGFSVADAGGTISGGSLVTDLAIIDNGGSNLTLNTGINLGTDGLHIGLDGIGGATGIDVRMANLSLDGGTNTLGDIELIGLQLSGDLIVNGH